jgi:hypothetical protein
VTRSSLQSRQGTTIQLPTVADLIAKIRSSFHAICTWVHIAWVVATGRSLRHWTAALPRSSDWLYPYSSSSNITVAVDGAPRAVFPQFAYRAH